MVLLIQHSPKMKAEAIQEKAFSYATIQYTTEERAKLNGMSAQKIAEIVNQEHKVTLQPTPKDQLTKQRQYQRSFA